MYFSQLFASITAFAAGLVAATVPGYSQHNVTRPDGTIVSAYFRGNFVATTDNRTDVASQDPHLLNHFGVDFYQAEGTQSMCSSSYISIDDMTTGFSPWVSDCEILMDVVLYTPGYWEVTEWETGAYGPLAFASSCIVGLARSLGDDLYKNPALIGNMDVLDWLGISTYSYVHDLDGGPRTSTHQEYWCVDPEQNHEMKAKLEVWITHDLGDNLPPKM